MELLQKAAEIFQGQLGGEKKEGLKTNSIVSAFQGLLGGADGKVDFQSLIGKFQSLGLTSMVTSWLGDGKNEDLPEDSVKSALGEGKVEKFASSLGLDTSTALKGLSGALPKLIDQFSSGGESKEGGLGSMLSAAKGLFGS